MSDPTWPRPVPLIGDRTSAADRAADPAGWALGEPVASALATVLAARRDVRRFRPDPVPPELLRQVLAAGHQAPSVGHSQPWRFIVITEQATRDRAALLADRERLRQADMLTPDRRARLLDLQLEGIREAPLGVVVACDRRVPAAGVLGRASFTDTDMWSCACAVQNMWLAARAAGLGLGWVTLFRPADLADVLGLPDGVATLGWLCLGWPDERPPEPGLERHGWSRRLPLDDVVIAERWPCGAQPGDGHSAELAGGGSAADCSTRDGRARGAPVRGTPIRHQPRPPVSHLAGPDQRAVVAGRDAGDDLLTAPGSLGVLDATVSRVLALRPVPPDGGTLIVAAADHPVAGLGVSAYPASVTADVLAATRLGVSLGAATARQAGLRVEAVHARAAGLTGDLASTDAMKPADVTALIDQGWAAGQRLAAHGLVCLGEVGIGNTTVAAALSCVLLGLDPESAVGLGAGADAAILTRKRDVVTDAVSRAQATHGDSLDDPRVLTAAVGGPEIALLTGVTLGAASCSMPVVLDGLVTSVAALLAVRLDPGVQTRLVAGQQSRERAHAAVLTELGLEPLLKLRLRAGEGVGACLAAQMLLTAIRSRQAAARVRARGD
jgi:nicotinate-nucleotide--dimethylbenzimidazole phosphoribosyltransferase